MVTNVLLILLFAVKPVLFALMFVTILEFALTETVALLILVMTKLLPAIHAATRTLLALLPFAKHLLPATVKLY